MGDVRFARAYEALRSSEDRERTLHEMPVEEVVQALAGSCGVDDPLLANVLATEALNRVRRLRAALVSLGEGVIILSPSERIRWLNPAAEALLRTTRRLAIDKRLDEIARHVEEDGAPMPPERSPATIALRGMRATGHAECFRLCDTSIVCASYTSAPVVAPDGTVEGAVLVLRDASARRAAERELRESHERYKSLFEHLPIVVVDIGIDGTIRDANEAAVVITGWPLEQTVGTHYSRYLDPSGAAAVRRLFSNVVRGRREETLVRVRRPAGDTLELECTGIPIIVDGRVRGVFVLGRPAA